MALLFEAQARTATRATGRRHRRGEPATRTSSRPRGPPTENASTIRPPSNQRNQGPPTEQWAGRSALSRIFGGHNKDDTNHPQRQFEALTSRRRRPAAVLPSVGAFDDLFEGCAGDDAFEAADHDRRVLDEVGVALVGAGATMEAFEDASQAVDTPFHVLVPVERDPHHGVDAQRVEVAAFQGGKDVVVLLQDAVDNGAGVGHLFLLEHKNVGSGDDLERLVLVEVATLGVGPYHLEEL